MEIRVGDKIYNNYVPYKEKLENNEYEKLANYMLKCGFGYWKSNELYKLWNEVSDHFSASWLCIPDTIEDFRYYLSSLALSYESEDEEQLYTREYY